MFLSYTLSDRKVLQPNFKAVDQVWAELHILKVEKLDACIRLLFANLLTRVTGSVKSLNVSMKILTHFWCLKSLNFPTVASNCIKIGTVVAKSTTNIACEVFKT